MKKILILDGPGRVAGVCRRALDPEVYQLETIDDIKALLKKVAMFRFDLILLNVDSNQRGNIWDVLLDIKIQNPLLPVVLLFEQDKFLFDERLSQADGYVVIDCFFPEDLRCKTAQVLQQEATA